MIEGDFHFAEPTPPREPTPEEQAKIDANIDYLESLPFRPISGEW